MVIFKCDSNALYSNRNGIYIPIWLYSNEIFFQLIDKSKKFTFQYGYIQIIIELAGTKVDTLIYIPIWLYSNAFPHHLWKT